MESHASANMVTSCSFHLMLGARGAFPFWWRVVGLEFSLVSGIGTGLVSDESEDSVSSWRLAWECKLSGGWVSCTMSKTSKSASRSKANGCWDWDVNC